MSGRRVALTGKVDLETPACDELAVDPFSMFYEAERNGTPERVAIGG